jgi:hypothetical protein
MLPPRGTFSGEAALIEKTIVALLEERVLDGSSWNMLWLLREIASSEPHAT